MNETKFIISEKQILNTVKYALELNIQEQRIVDILMHDVEDEIETVLYDDCEEYKSDLCQDTANLLETLEQGLVLDRIKDEIRHEQNMDCKCHRKTYDNCLRIIDKYKTDIKGEE